MYPQCLLKKNLKQIEAIPPSVELITDKYLGFISIIVRNMFNSGVVIEVIEAEGGLSSEKKS